jgi:hypothetical protein
MDFDEQWKGPAAAGGVDPREQRFVSTTEILDLSDVQRIRARAPLDGRAHRGSVICGKARCSCRSGDVKVISSMSAGSPNA